MNNLLKQEQFFKQYPKSKEIFEKTKLKWDMLESIYDDYTNDIKDFEIAGEVILKYLQPIKKIHSLRYRVKDSEHLVEKIIRKTEERQKDEAEKQIKMVNITLDNYTTEITDLVGVRALHLYKDDWIDIHNNIKESWKLAENPKAYIRKGDKDAEALFEANGCCHEEHKAGYRSVHYLIELRPRIKTIVAEVQVRTIFEEGWSEIDHNVRYPYDLDNPILNEYLLFFNRMAGSADEMGTYIKMLKSRMEERDNSYRLEIEKLVQENKSIIKELTELKRKSKMDEEDKQKLQSIIDSLSKKEQSKITTFNAFEPNSRIGVGFKDILTPNPSSNIIAGIIQGDIIKTINISDDKCKHCGKDLSSIIKINNQCPYCKKNSKD